MKSRLPSLCFFKCNSNRYTAVCGAASAGAAPFSAVAAPAGVAPSQPPSGGPIPGAAAAAASTVLKASVGAGAVGALVWALPAAVVAAGPLTSYVLRAHVYDNDAPRAAHWLAPSPTQCIAGAKPSRGSSTSAAPTPGLGIFTPATGGSTGGSTNVTVGLYQSNAVDPWLESAWFQPSSLPLDPS
jgi:hypothetical protein